MAYMGNRWGAPPPKPKASVKSIEYTEKKEFDTFAHNVRHDLVKIVDFINKEVEPDVNHIRTDLDETMHRTDVLARHVYELQHEVRELREKESCASAAKRRLRVTVCAGKDKVQIIRND
jgi:BMFP domain-containing protein YqiC